MLGVILAIGAKNAVPCGLGCGPRISQTAANDLSAEVCNSAGQIAVAAIETQAVALFTAKAAFPHHRCGGEAAREEVAMSDDLNVVLVHGGFVDGSGWQGVYDLLTADGYRVSVVQNPTLSLKGDASATRMILDRQEGPTILVGHSYGGAVISEAGTHERVAGLVYICAFTPDAGESVNTLLGTFPTDGPQPPILAPVEGFLFLDRDKFHKSFAGDIPAQDAAFLADAQVPWGVEALSGNVTEAAWRSKESWYLITAGDRMIPPDAQRTMSERIGATVVEVDASHAVYVSQPAAVADLIKQAATATAAAKETTTVA
jgi:pimeloyl-ACP methyl ester carboxylesterase